MSARPRPVDAEEVPSTWQLSPGTVGRPPVLGLLAATSRGVVAHGLLLADLEPPLDRVAAEVRGRRQC